MKQRIIKFRAWDKKRKKMMFVQELDWQTNTACTSKRPSNLTVRDTGKDALGGVYELIEGQPRYNEIADNFILMQYINREDKNGREIYEKDIIKYKSFDDSEQIAEVPEIMNWHWFGELEDCKDLEVIGNRLENPKLLKNHEEI